MYYRTAGEIEARDTASRRTLTDEQRKEKRPDIDRDDVVFADGGVSYDIGVSEDNEPVIIISDNILKGFPKNEWLKRVKNNMKNKYSKGIPFKGKLFLITKDSRREYTYSKYSKAIRNTSFFKDKMKASNHLDEIIIASTNYINEDLNHQRKDSIVQFARGDVNLKIGNHGYEAKIIVGFTKKGELILYDIIDMIPKSFKIKKGTKTVPVHQQGGSNSSQSVPSGTNIPQTNNNSKPSTQKISDSGNAADIENGLKSKDDTIYDDDFEQAWWDSVAGTLET